VVAGEGSDELRDAVGLLDEETAGGVAAVVELGQEFLGAEGADEGEGLVLLFLNRSQREAHEHAEY